MSSRAPLRATSASCPATSRCSACWRRVRVTIRTTGESGEGTVVAAVHGGFLSFADDKLSLLAEVAELADEIDVERAERALERAKSDTDAAAERRAEVRMRAVAAR